MEFSVLLSLYFKESPTFLRQALESVFNQTRKPSEVILVLDGPVGKELNQVIEDFKRDYEILKIIPLNENKGLGLALNEGLNHCSNEIVARMDTDDICKPYRFEHQIGFMEAHPEYDVVGAWIDEFSGNVDNVLSTRSLPENYTEIFNFAKKRNPINHPVVAFRKSAVIKSGNYQPFYLFEDYYLWVRMLINGSRFYNIQESLLWFRFSPDMFKRRGGIKYALVESSFYRRLYQLQFIGISTMIKNTSVRFVARIVPNKIRSMIYMKLLRK